MTHAAVLATLVLSASLARTAEPVHVIAVDFDENTARMGAIPNAYVELGREPNAAVAEQAAADASGIALRNEGDPRRVVIWKVASDSPGSEAGIQPGDLILRIGDVSQPTLWPARRALMREGKTVRLAVERSGKRLDFALLLRRLL